MLIVFTIMRNIAFNLISINIFIFINNIIYIANHLVNNNTFAFLFQTSLVALHLLVKTIYSLHSVKERITQL